MLRNEVQDSTRPLPCWRSLATHQLQRQQFQAFDSVAIGAPGVGTDIGQCLWPRTVPRISQPRGQRIEPDNVTRVSSIPFCDDVLDPSVPVLQLVDVSKQLGVVITRVHQMLRDRQILAIKRDGVLAVPEAFFGEDGHLLKSVPA